MTRNWQRLEEELKREKLFSSRWPWRSTMESGWLPKGQVLVKGNGGNFGCSVECIISFFPFSGVSRPQSRTWSLCQPGRSSPPIGKTKCWSRFFQSWKENQGTCVGPWWILPHLSPSMWEGSCAEWTWKDTCQPQATTRLSWRFVLRVNISLILAGVGFLTMLVFEIQMKNSSKWKPLGEASKKIKNRGGLGGSEGPNMVNRFFPKIHKMIYMLWNMK